MASLLAFGEHGEGLLDGLGASRLPHVPVLATPSLLTATEQSQLWRAWSAALLSGVARARANVAAAVAGGAAPIGAAPQEVDFIYGFLEVGIPRMAREIHSVFQAHGREVRVGGVFCHQTPRVSFRYLNGSTWQDDSCELGDLLLVVHYRERWGEELNALLMQFKVDDFPKADLGDPQWRLYSEWPSFEWDFRPHYRRSPRPRGPHEGAINAVIYESGAAPLGRPADVQVAVRQLATLLNRTTLLLGGRAFKTRDLARSEAHGGWSEVIWDLIETTAQRLVTRRRSKVVGQPRWSGILPMLPSGGAIPRLLEDAVRRAAADHRNDVELFSDDASNLIEDLGPPGPTPRDEGEDPDDAGVSVLLVEISSQFAL